MPNTPIQHLGQGNGMPEGCIAKVELDNDEQIGTANVTLEQLMKIAWLVKKMSWEESTQIDFGSGYTYRDSDYSSGSVSYPEVKPKNRLCGLGSFIDEDLEPWEAGTWATSMGLSYPTSGVNVVYAEIEFNYQNGFSIIDDEADGERKFFHGLEFSYYADNFETTDYGGYQSAVVKYRSGPMASAARFAELNQNYTEEYFEGGEDDGGYSIGFWYQYNSYSESVVNIEGIPFLKTVQYSNGGILNGYDTTQLPLPSGLPSLTFYDYPTS